MIVHSIVITNGVVIFPMMNVEYVVGMVLDWILTVMGYVYQNMIAMDTVVVIY